MMVEVSLESLFKVKNGYFKISFKHARRRGSQKEEEKYIIGKSTVNCEIAKALVKKKDIRNRKEAKPKKRGQEQK